MSDFISLICKISPDLLIDTDKEITDILNAVTSHGFVFDAGKLTESGNVSPDFARFIYELDNLKKFGVETYPVVSYTGSVLKITYFIKNNGFGMVTMMINKWISYNQNKSSYSVLAQKEFEKSFDENLQFLCSANLEEFIKQYE